MRPGILSIGLSKRKYGKKDSSNPSESIRRQKRALNRDILQMKEETWKNLCKEIENVEKLL